MAVAVNVNGLKELYQVRYEIIFRELVFWDIEFFHQVDESRQLKTLCVQLELFL